MTGESRRGVPIDPGAASRRRARPDGWLTKERAQADQIERDTGIKISFIQGGWLDPQPKPGERWLTLDNAHVVPKETRDE